MRRAMIVLVGFAAVLFSGVNDVAAKDSRVRGYYQKDGTYVRPHVRSAPDSDRSNNYGRPRNDADRLRPWTRDTDRDGIPNYLDHDDNNNGIPDQYDPAPDRLR
jgi:hypothetical protein